jgi:hypothetical protein
MRNLREFAMSRLRACFPTRYKEMLKVMIPPPVARNVAEPQAVAVNGRCAVRGCVFPSKLDGLCRTHYVDSKCEKSLLPSTTQAAIANLGMVVAL